MNHIRPALSTASQVLSMKLLEPHPCTAVAAPAKMQRGATDEHIRVVQGFLIVYGACVSIFEFRKREN